MLKRILALVSRLRLNQLLLGRGQDALQPDDNKNVDQL